jgi:hypothetical protein
MKLSLFFTCDGAQTAAQGFKERAMRHLQIFLRYLRAVLWGFIGLGGRSKDASIRLENANPLPLIAIAFAVVLAFLGCLVALARFAASA